MIPSIVIDRLRDLTAMALEQNGELHDELRAIEQSLTLRGEHVGYQPIHFTLNELVPPEIVAGYGEQAWQFLDDRLLWTLDAVWEHFKPDKKCKYCVVCNSWPWGGSNKYRGYRPKDCTVGADNSQHRHGRAVDITIPGFTPTDIYTEIVNNKSSTHFRYITAIKKYSWGAHIDCRNTHQYTILELS